MISKADQLNKSYSNNVRAQDFKTFIEYVRGNPCCVCGRLDVEAAHIPDKQMGGGNSDDWNTVPLCRDCHTLWHHKHSYRPYIEAKANECGRKLLAEWCRNGKK